MTNDIQESQEQIARFPDDDPSLLARYPWAYVQALLEANNLYRLIYFMYTGKLLTKPLTDTRIEKIEDVDDPYMCEDQTLMLAANIYSIAIKHGASDLARLASCMFTTSIVKQFHRLPDWTELVAFVYESTPPDARDLRNIIVRRLQRNTRLRKKDTRLDMDELKKVVRKIPELAEDLATILFTDEDYTCTDCGTVQALLELPCNHEKAHKSGDKECFALNLEKQECYRCHGLGTLAESK